MNTAVHSYAGNGAYPPSYYAASANPTPLRPPLRRPPPRERLVRVDCSSSALAFSTRLRASQGTTTSRPAATTIAVTMQATKVRTDTPEVAAAATQLRERIAAWDGELLQRQTANFQDIIKRHMIMIMKYPHNKLGKGRPYEGIENLRPESKMAVETFMSWQPPQQ